MQGTQSPDSVHAQVKYKHVRALRALLTYKKKGLHKTKNKQQQKNWRITVIK